MTLWAVETCGRAVVVFAADTLDEAAEAIESESTIADDLQVFQGMDGQPLWDGESELSLREAEAEEQAAWDSSIARAILEGEVESREHAIEEGVVVFLVPAAGPTGEDSER
jgi:hypothetical protein